jgi:glycosyltransferase involved in cell wall biosynthesis
MPIEKGTIEIETKRLAACMKSAAVISLHFSPAHASHMVAYGKVLRDLGFDVSYVVEDKYLSVADFSAVGETIPAAHYARDPGCRRFDIALLCNSSTNNRSVARDMRARGASIFYLFHEPDSIWNLGLEGWRIIVSFPFSTLCSIATLRLCSGVIVPSERARSLYEKHYLKYNGNVRILPLLFDDEIGAERIERTRHQKRYFGYVGIVCNAHRFDAFIAFAKYAIRNGSTIPFAIATKVNLTSLLAGDKELARYVSEGKIRLQHGRVLSNEEINQYSLDCFCVWNVYRRSMQSGVLPRAFMAGSPVVATRVGSFPEYIREGITGEFVDSADDPREILEVAERIRNRFPTYVDACREKFLETFYYKANGDRLAAILDKACESPHFLYHASGDKEGGCG